MGIPLNLLIVEDSPDDAELLVNELRSGGFDVHWERVDAEADFLARLARQPDLIVSDFSLPQFSGLKALELLRHRNQDIPFILVSGSTGEDRAVEAMKRGATDYLLKDRLARLPSAVTHALEEKRLRAQAAANHAQLAEQATALQNTEARLAGIMASKKTADLIPLCHPLPLEHAEVNFQFIPQKHQVHIECKVEVFGRTGVEMEALLGVSTAALTIYDMLKSIDRGLVIGPTRLVEKSGGRSGHYLAPSVVATGEP